METVFAVNDQIQALLQRNVLWSVVEFFDNLEESAAIEVIPTIWITIINNEITCKWPDKNPRKAIKKCAVSKSSWKIYKIKTILLQTDTYKSALEFAIKKTQTDTDISVPEVQKRRKPKRKNLDDYMTTELSDNSESQRMTPPPKLLTLCDSAIDRGNVFPKNDTNIAPTDKTINDNDFHDNDKENQSPNEIETNNLDCLNDNEDLESYHRIGNASQETMFTPNFVRNILFEDLPSDSQNIIKILENTIVIRKLLEEQKTFLEQKKENAPVMFTDPNCNNLSIPTKPYKKFKKLQEYDTSLRINTNKRKQLETYFYLLGGDSPQNQIKNSLEKIFTNKLGMKCSWKGQKENFAVNMLIIMEIIKCATRKHFPNLTDKQMQNYVSAWLKYAKTRYDRQQVKYNRNKNFDMPQKVLCESVDIVRQTNSRKVFGIPLYKLDCGDGKVPLVVDRLITIIEMHGLYTEGIYRKSGVSSKVRELKMKMDEGSLEKVDFENYQVHVLAV